jgi:hypothetical protein
MVGMILECQQFQDCVGEGIQQILFVNFVILLVPKEKISIFTFGILFEDLNNGSKSYGGSRSNKISNYDYPEDKEEWLEAENNQEDKAFRKVPFLENYLLKEDF